MEETEKMAVGCDDGRMGVFSAETGDIAHTLEGHEDAVSCLRVSANGKLLVWGSDEKTLQR